MKPQMLARMRAATDLVRNRNLSGAMDLIREALQQERPGGNSDSSPGTATSPHVVAPRLLASTAASTESQPIGSREVATDPGLPKASFDLRPRRPLSDSLRLLRQRPLALSEESLPPFPKPGRAAPDPLPQGATFETFGHMIGAGQRQYKVYLPRPFDGTPRPLVVMLHGCTQDADDFALGTRMNRLADELDFVVVYPQQSPAANKLKCWSWFSPLDQQRDRGEPAIIAGITRTVAAKHHADPRRIYIAGLSAGGAMAAVMGETYPDLFSAVGIHSGLPYKTASDVPSAFAAMRNGSVVPDLREFHGAGTSSAKPRCIVFHGQADATVHPVNGERVFEEACRGRGVTVEVDNRRGSTGPSCRRQIARSMAGEIVAEHWSIPGGGHAWFGGDARGSYVNNNGPDASREMLRFFLGAI